MEWLERMPPARRRLLLWVGGIIAAYGVLEYGMVLALFILAELIVFAASWLALTAAIYATFISLPALVKRWNRGEQNTERTTIVVFLVMVWGWIIWFLGGITLEFFSGEFMVPYW